MACAAAGRQAGIGRVLPPHCLPAAHSWGGQGAERPWGRSVNLPAPWLPACPRPLAALASPPRALRTARRSRPWTACRAGSPTPHPSCTPAPAGTWCSRASAGWRPCGVQGMEGGGGCRAGGLLGCRCAPPAARRPRPPRTAARRWRRSPRPALQFPRTPVKLPGCRLQAPPPAVLTARARCACTC